MPGFSIDLPHSLGKQDAIQRLRDVLSQVQERYANQISDLEESWEEDTLLFSFATFGFRISGQLEVEDDSIQMKGNLPIAAMMFKGKIESSLRDELGKVLA